MPRVVVAHSEDPDAAAALVDIAQQLASSDAVVPRAGLLFTSIDADHATLLAGLRQRWPGLPLVGCTTDGEASTRLGMCEASVLLVLLSGADLEVTAGLGRDMSRDLAAAARAAVDVARAQATQPPRLALIFPDSLTTSGVAIVEALKDQLGPDFPILGGTAGDHLRFERTHQFFGDEVLSDALPLLLLSGPVALAHGVASGWQPIGRRCKVTRAERNVVHEIDGVPALTFCRSYLGADATPMGEYPLAVFEDDGGGGFYLRAPFAHDEAAGSITFAGDIPVGAEVQLSDVHRRDILAAVRDSTAQALEGLGGGRLRAALFFSCAGRKSVLGTQASTETETLRAGLPEGVPIAGIYAYGEIGPLTAGGQSRFHNETFVTLLLGDEA